MNPEGLWTTATQQDVAQLGTWKEPGVGMGSRGDLPKADRGPDKHEKSIYLEIK